MATLDDLKGVLESIDRTMIDQKGLLTTMITEQRTRDRLSSVDSSTVNPAASTGQSIGAAAAGIGSGVGNAAVGLGVGGLAALAGMAMFADFDAQAIKDNVVTLLSISDEVGGKAEMLKEGGTFFLAMTGLALGLAAFGVGQGLVGLGQWITDDQWTQTLKTNVVDLLSIADEVGGNLSMLFESGTVGLALGGLGAGLAAFGVGQSLAGIGQWLTDDTWAEQVKSNVLTLLSIGEEIPENVSALDEAGTFFFAMSGLGAGLAVFGVGQAAVGLAQFISSDDWAQKVKDNVVTLLSISELDGIGWNTVGFVAVMGGIAAGLAAFALGKGGAVVVDGAAEALGYFTGDSFADKIKSEVETLLSIPQMEGVAADTAGFIAVMAGISTGLAAFALGKGAATVVDGAAEALAYFTGDEPFADKIKSEVETLLSIVGLAPEGSVDEFTNIMGKLGDGLSSFAGGNLVGALKNVGTALLGFFSGQESPFEQIRMIASDADNLVKAADAIEKIANSLEKFGSINVDVGEIDFEKLALNLGKAIPLLDALANGGEVVGSDGWLSSPLIFPKGILDSSLKLDEMAEAISKVNYVLGQTTEYPAALQESAAAAAREASIPVNNVDQTSILTMQTEKMIELSQNILKSLEVIASTVPSNAQPAAASVVANSGNTDARQTSTNINITNNQSQRNYSELNQVARLGF
jgi:hypothetical protein